MSEAAELLREAHELVEKGWIKNNYYNDDVTAFCSSGALRQAGDRSNWEYEDDAEALLARVIREQFPDRGAEYCQICHKIHDDDMQEVIVAFNDHKDTTKEDVLAVFEKAIMKAEEVID